MSEASCRYDNPSTCRREWWSGGKLMAFVVEGIFYQHNVDVTLFGGPWETGRIVGDPKAMEVIV